MKRMLNIFANINIGAGMALLFIPVVFLLILGIINNGSITIDPKPVEANTEQIVAPDYKPVTNVETKSQILVPESEATTYGYRVIIPSIGVDTLIYECASSECGLSKNAAWRIPEFGTPEDTDNTTVIAAHRWGPDNFSTAKRTKELFYAFDKVQAGDLIEIEWNNKTYQYYVTFKDENIEITREDDDLILFTCKYYSSPYRIIVYAKLVI